MVPKIVTVFVSNNGQQLGEALDVVMKIGLEHRCVLVRFDHGEP